LEQRLRDAGPGLLSEAELDRDRHTLAALREQGRAVRVNGRLYAHAEILGEMTERVLAIIAREGSTTLAAVRDEVGISRKSAQAFLEHLDERRFTRRLEDDRRVLGPKAPVGRP
jgi:selenocysteine-specific elongation factor